VHGETGTYFKWCKGCKRFRNIVAFSEKLDASKCNACRERGRRSYLQRKGVSGEALEEGAIGNTDAGTGPVNTSAAKGSASIPGPGSSGLGRATSPFKAPTPGLAAPTPGFGGGLSNPPTPGLGGGGGPTSQPATRSAPPGPAVVNTLPTPPGPMPIQGLGVTRSHSNSNTPGAGVAGGMPPRPAVVNRAPPGPAKVNLGAGGTGLKPPGLAQRTPVTAKPMGVGYTPTGAAAGGAPPGPAPLRTPTTTGTYGGGPTGYGPPSRGPSY